LGAITFPLLSDLDNDKRLNEILEMIGRVAALDFSRMLPVSKNNDMIDAIALGLNMLSEELNSNVVEKSKLDSVNAKLEKFAYTTAHDLRSPLNSISGLVTLLELTVNPEKNSEVDLYISKLKATTEQMKSLVQGILEYSKANVGSVLMEDIDLNSVLKSVIDTDQLAERALIKIIDPLPCVYFNKSAMDQIIRNLLSNAVKYSDKKVCEIVVHGKEVEGRYQIAVTDNGPGIAPEHQEKIFELFNKVESEVKADSHGIGLATVRSILNAFGERIWVKSSVGEGATFYFTMKKRR